MARKSPFGIPFHGYSVVLFLLQACGSASQVGEINVDFDEDFDFESVQTFTVLTEEIVPEAEALETDAELFNDRVNDLIIEAMTAPPVCLTYIPPEEVTETNEPDLFAGNGVTRTTGQGTRWQCVGGWWWGAWGWFWDPCRWRTPVTVELDIGTLYLPVGPRPEEGTDPEPAFIGTARKILGVRTDVDASVRTAVREVFRQWPDARSCSR